VGLAFAAFVSVLLAGSTALAANRASQEKEARKACLNGDYARGVSILSDLFVSTKNPTYLFNQGRCFEQNRKYEEAIARFEEYLRAVGAGELNLKASDKGQAEKRIQKCKELLAEQESRNAATAPQAFVPPPASAPPPEPVAVAPAPVVVVRPAPAAEARGTSGLLIGGIITATLGAGALTTGVVLNIKANKMVDDMYKKPNGYSSSDDSTRKTYRTLGWVGYGVGAACLAAGAVLVGLSLRGDSRPSSDVALVPSMGNGHAGLVLSGGF
jgi:tetratricopeptide (TPR) repeat protein